MSVFAMRALIPVPRDWPMLQILPFNHTMEAEALVSFVAKLQDRVKQEGQQIDLTPLQEVRRASISVTCASGGRSCMV